MSLTELALVVGFLGIGAAIVLLGLWLLGGRE